MGFTWRFGFDRCEPRSNWTYITSISRSIRAALTTLPVCVRLHSSSISTGLSLGGAVRAVSFFFSLRPRIFWLAYLKGSLSSTLLLYCVVLSLSEGEEDKNPMREEEDGTNQRAS